MPTLEHNGLVAMFRENPNLAPHFLTILFHLDVPPYTDVQVADSGLDQLIPVEFRADLVLELRDEKGSIVLAIVLEAQRDKEPRKKYSWLVYIAVARAERECPTIVLVVAPDADVASWAAEKVDVGLGLSILQPLVLGPSVVPVVTDPAVAEQEMELTILSAMAHGNGPTGQAAVEAALIALDHLDREHATVYFQIIYNALREPMRRALEALIMERQSETKATFPSFIQRLIDEGELKGKLEGETKGKIKGKIEGEIKGKREGKIEGKREGKIEGKIEGKREALLRVLARAGLELTEDDRVRVQTCVDSATLDRWIDNVVGAKTPTDVLT